MCVCVYVRARKGLYVCDLSNYCSILNLHLSNKSGLRHENDSGMMERMERMERMGVWEVWGFGVTRWVGGAGRRVEGH